MRLHFHLLHLWKLMHPFHMRYHLRFSAFSRMLVVRLILCPKVEKKELHLRTPSKRNPTICKTRAWQRRFTLIVSIYLLTCVSLREMCEQGSPSPSLSVYIQGNSCNETNTRLGMGKRVKRFVFENYWSENSISLRNPVMRFGSLWHKAKRTLTKDTARKLINIRYSHTDVRTSTTTKNTKEIITSHW